MTALDLLGDVTEEEADRLVTDYATDMSQDVVDACNALLRARRERAVCSAEPTVTEAEIDAAKDAYDNETIDYCRREALVVALLAAAKARAKGGAK